MTDGGKAKSAKREEDRDRKKGRVNRKRARDRRGSRAPSTPPALTPSASAFVPSTHTRHGYNCILYLLPSHVDTKSSIMSITYMYTYRVHTAINARYSQENTFTRQLTHFLRTSAKKSQTIGFDRCARKSVSLALA